MYLLCSNHSIYSPNSNNCNKREKLGIEFYKMAHSDIAESVNQFVADLIALDEPGLENFGFDNSAAIIAGDINELVAELIDLAGNETASAKTIRETIKKQLIEIINLKRNEIDTESNNKASAATTDTRFSLAGLTLITGFVSFINYLIIEAGEFS